MLTWLQANLGTMIVLLVLISIVTAIIAHMIKNKRSGHSACGCGCQNCAMQGACRGNNRKPQQEEMPE